MIQERLTSNASPLTNSYVYGLDLSGTTQGAGTIGGLLSASFGGASSCETVFYAYDANGNVTDLVGTNGQFLAQYQYDPYGNLTQASGSEASANPFKFSTKYLDVETGLYYYGYRYYMPEMGRWCSRDPIGEESTVSRFAIHADRRTRMLLVLESQRPPYLFVHNHPVNYFDPFGLQVYGGGYCITWTDPIFGGTYTACYPEPEPPPCKFKDCHEECSHVFLETYESCIQPVEAATLACIGACQFLRGDPRAYVACMHTCHLIDLSGMAACGISASAAYSGCMAGCLSAE